MDEVIKCGKPGVIFTPQDPGTTLLKSGADVFPRSIMDALLYEDTSLDRIDEMRELLAARTVPVPSPRRQPPPVHPKPRRLSLPELEARWGINTTLKRQAQGAFYLSEYLSTDTGRL